MFESRRKRKHKLITWGDSKNISNSKGVKHILLTYVLQMFLVSTGIFKYEMFSILKVGKRECCISFRRTAK